MDLTEVHKFDDLVATIAERHGKLDILFNNAGILGPGNMGQITEADYDSLNAINLKSPVFLTQSAMPYLKVNVLLKSIVMFSL